MKKNTLLKVLPAAALSLSLLAGCTSNDGPSRGSIGDREEEPTPTEEAAPTEAEPTPTPEPDIEPEPVAEKPEYRQLEFQCYPISNVYYSKDLDMRLASSKADQITLLEEDLPELAAVIEEYSDDMYDRVEGKQFGDLVDMGEENAANGMPMEMTEEYSTYIERADTVVTSILTDYEGYYGGAHGIYTFVPTVYDSVTGEELHIDDVLEGDQILEIPGILQERLIEEYGEEVFNDAEDLASTISQMYMDDGDLQFSLGYEGISFYFQVYTLGPYASGMQVVTLKYEDYPGLVREEYTDCAQDYIVNSRALVGKLPHTDLDFLAGAVSDDDFNMSLYYHLNGADYKDEFYGFDADVWVATIGHINYMFVNVVHENDYETIRIYSLNENDPAFIAEFDGGFYNRVPSDPYEFRIYQRGDLMSTYDMYKDYYIGRTGEPVSTDPYYIIDMGGISGFGLTAKKDMAVMARDSEDSNDYTEVKIKAKDKLYFYATDNQSWVDFKLQDGSIVRFELDQPLSYPQSIDGVDIADLFDNILFAG